MEEGNDIICVISCEDLGPMRESYREIEFNSRSEGKLCKLEREFLGGGELEKLEDKTL